MISEIANIQALVKENLEYGYSLELTLAGFIFEKLEVQFNRSTLNDEYKLQQGLEIKIRNAQAKYYSGIINMDQFADELGYDKAAEDKPREEDPFANKGGGLDSKTGSAGNGKRQDTKNKSAKKTRDAGKAVPKKQ